MDSSPADPPPANRSEVGARGQPEPRAQQPVREESGGPVTFKRHVKGDGRALILYSHDERRQA